MGFGFVVCFLEGEGDGRSGTLGQGREASLRLPHVSLLRRTREAGCLVRKTLLDHLGGMGVRLNFRRWGWESPKGTTVESEPGARSPLASPAMEGPVYSRAMRIALTRTRRVRGASSRPVSQAYMLLRVDGPSIAWVSGKGTRDPWGEEMAAFACAAGLREGRWDGLRR